MPVGIAELSDANGNDALTTKVVAAHKASFFCRRGHVLLGRKEITLAELLQYPWVTTRMLPQIAAAFPKKLGRAGRIDDANGDFVPAIELDVPMQLAAFASKSDALAIGGFSMVAHELRTGSLAVMTNLQVDMRTQYGFIWLRHRSLSPTALAYMQAVRDEERSFAKHEERLAAIYERKRRPTVRP